MKQNCHSINLNLQIKQTNRRNKPAVAIGCGVGVDDASVDVVSFSAEPNVTGEIDCIGVSDVVEISSNG